MIGRRSATSVAALYRQAYRYTASGRSLAGNRYRVKSPSAATVVSTATVNGSLSASLSSRSYFSSMAGSAYDARIRKDHTNYHTYSTASPSNEESSLNLLQKLMLKIKKIWTGYDDTPKTEVLDRFGIDLTELAKSSKLDPVIGRHDEIRRCIQILSRKRKGNPVIVGEPGVGKTAIAEGLAQRIATGDVPDALRNHKLISLDMGLLHAGASYHGEFEKRLKSVLKEATNSKVVIFLDEIHMLVGAGDTIAANLIKPPLARGDIRCVGATTLDEYRNHIETDPALESEPPTVRDTITFLRGLRNAFEMHHGVMISDMALVAASMLADRYITERNLPVKAIDLIDESCAKLKTALSSKPAELRVQL